MDQEEQGNPQLLIKFRARQVYKRPCLQNQRAGRKRSETGRRFIFCPGDDGVCLLPPTAKWLGQQERLTLYLCSALEFSQQQNNKKTIRNQSPLAFPIRELSLAKLSLFSSVSFSLKNSSSSVLLSDTSRGGEEIEKAWFILAFFSFPSCLICIQVLCTSEDVCGALAALFHSSPLQTGEPLHFH